MALTYERVREMLHYVPETGVSTWKVNFGTCKIGKPVKGGLHRARPNAKLRGRVRVDGKLYKTSRLVWFWVTGSWPTGEIDHKDNNPLNNRWLNLRDVTSQVNNQNLPVRIDNKSGVRGVWWCASAKRWHVYINKDKKRRFVGSFGLFEEAVNARHKVEIEIFDLPKVV